MQTQQERSKVKQAKNIDKKTLFAVKTEKVEMTLNTDSELAQGMLIQRLTELYEDPIEASVRETISNGIDAVSVAHSGKRPEVKVYTPSNLNPVLVIKDNGIGMTYKDLVEVYAKYGASTKADDLNQIGAYGLGAKAPLSYGNEFTVTSIKDNFKTTILVAREEMTNYIKVVDSAETSEPSGTTVSIPLNNSDVERFKENVERYKQTPLDKDIDLYINDELVNADQYKLLSDNVLIYNGAEKVTGRVWLDKENIVQLLSNVSVSNLKESLKYVIGGWKYDSPSIRNSFYASNYGIVVELKAGIVGFNSSRDAILSNDRYKDLEDLMVEYISSDDFINDVTEVVNSLELEEFKELVSKLISKNRNMIKVEDGKIIIDNTGSSRSYYNSPVKRNFSLENFVHNETGFNFNYIIENIPEDDGKTVIFRELKSRHYESVSNYMMDNGDSYSNNSFTEANISKINSCVDEVFNNLQPSHKLGSLMIYLSTVVYDSQENDGMALTFVTDMEDKDEIKRIKSARKAIVRMSVNDETDTKYSSVVVYTDHKKETMEKMLEELGIEDNIPVKIETAETILEDVKEFRAKTRARSGSTSRKQKDLRTSLIKLDFENGTSNTEEVKNLNKNKKNLVVVIKQYSYIDYNHNKQILSWFCNENELKEEEVDMYVSRGTLTAVDVAILNDATDYVFRDPRSDKAGMSKAYYETIHDNVAGLNTFTNSEEVGEEEAFVFLIAELASSSTEAIAHSLHREFREAYRLSGLSETAMPTFPGNRIKEIAKYDEHTLKSTRRYGRIDSTALEHLVNQLSDEKLELAQNVSELLGNNTVIKNSEGKYALRYTDGVKKYYYASIKEVYDNNESVTKQKAKLMKVTNEIYLEFIKEVVLGLEKMNFKK